jgi:N-acetylglucosaminyl-diphospho-decaprenol L-rhamnosyltransferase
MTPTSLDALTVVLANYGTPDYTLRAVGALLGDGVAPGRIVVVDNGSADASFERFQAEIADCVLVRLEENIGFARASNRGALELPGEAYLFVNTDAFVHAPGTTARLVAALDDPRVGVVVPRVLNEDGTLQPNVVPTSRPSVALVRASGLSRFVPNRWQPHWSTHWDHGASREIEAANGAVLLVRGETWDALGGFDADLFMYAEDLDLCWRARGLGWKVWFVHDAEFVHLGGGATGRDWMDPARAERIGRSEARMIRRHLGSPAAALTLAVMSGGTAARLLVHRARRNERAAAQMRGSLRGYRARRG